MRCGVILCSTIILQILSTTWQKERELREYPETLVAVVLEATPGFEPGSGLCRKGFRQV